MQNVTDFINKVKCLDSADKLRILELLIRDGEKSITDVRKELRLSFSTTHKFLTEMEKSGLLSSRTTVDKKLKKLYKVEDFNLQLSPESIINLFRTSTRQIEKPYGIKVIDSDGEIREFGLEDLKKICTGSGVSIWITNRVVDSIKNKLHDGLSISEVRNYVLNRLREEIESLGKTVDKLTASELFGVNTLFQLFESKNLKEALRAHIECDMHIRNVASMKPISIQHDMRLTLQNGLVFGNKKLTEPASRLNSLLDHFRVLIEEASQDIVVVHGFDHFNVFLAPYTKNMSYMEIKQALREFLFKIKILFETKNIQTYINMDSQIPKHIKNLDAIGSGGKVVGGYSEFEDEAQKILNAWFDTISESKDVFDYPRTILKIWSNKRKVFDISKLENSLKNLSCFYVANMNLDWQTENANFMDEVTRLDSSWKGWEGTKGTGNLQTVTLNLPRIAYEAKGNDDKLFEILKERVDLAKKILLATAEIIAGRTFVGDSVFLSKSINGERYFHVDDALNSLAFGGLNELVKIHTGDEIHESKEALHFTIKVIDSMNKFLKEAGAIRIGLNECLSTWTKRFAVNDMIKFGAEKVFVKGDSKNPYYTTGANISNDVKMSNIERLSIEARFHPKIIAGHMSTIKYGKNLNLTSIFKSKTGFVKVLTK